MALFGFNAPVAFEGMSQLSGSGVGNGLTTLLMCDGIEPGDAPSYAVCKLLYTLHPVGKKMVDAPLGMAQSQAREITVATAPDMVRDRFVRQWEVDGADRKIEALARIARIYGTGAFGIVQQGVQPSQPLDFKSLAAKSFTVNVLDPLNTAGSIGIRNQDPNSAAFQQTPEVRVSGVSYHPSRSFVLLNEMPIYIDYTSSAFGYSGRSVYQRALYPLKSFVQTMRTDDLVTRKAGVIVAKIKQIGGITDNIQAGIFGIKRALVKIATTDDVLSVGNEDTVESLNMMNLEGPYALARKNIIENIATAADMPAIVLNSETYAEGFGEGTEDAKKVASFVDGIRLWMNPAYDFLDQVVMYRAWTPDFYEEVRAAHPEEFGGVDYDAAFQLWKGSFRATWPSLITEPESKKVEVAKVRFEAVTSNMELLLPKLDPTNTVNAISWLVDTINESKDLFPVPFQLDLDALEEFVAKQAEAAERMQEAGAQAAENGAAGDDEEPKPGRPFADSVARLLPRRA